MGEPVEQEIVIGPRAAADADLLAAITAEYGIGGVREVRDLGGTFNLNLLVRTADAAYVARVYRPWTTPARLAFVQATKRDLARSGFPVVEVLATQHGERMVRVGDRWLEVEPCVAHDGVADSWEANGEAFAELGRLHDLLGRLLPAASFVAPAVSNYAEPDVLTRWIEQTRIAVATQGPSPSTHRAERVCRDALACLHQVREWWDGARGHLPVQAIHGDFGGGNVLFAGHRVVAVLDFDFLGRRERVFDLAYTLYWWMRPLMDMDVKDLPWRRVSSLLARYEAATSQPLTDAEVHALPIEIARVPLYWIGEAHLTVDPVASVLDGEAGVIHAGWLLRHQAAIRAELAAGRGT